MIISDFLTDDETKMFLRRLSAVARNTDFDAIFSDLRKVLSGIDGLLRTVDDVTKMRQLQGSAQILNYLLTLVEQAKTGQI